MTFTVARRHLLTRQMVRQWLALCRSPPTDRQGPVFGDSLADLFGFADFQLLEPLELRLDLPLNLLVRSE